MQSQFPKIGVLTLVLFCVFYVSVLYAANSSVSVEVIIPECNDGLDNDSDLLVDYPYDLGCSSATDNDETDPIVSYQCNDGVDNDSDSRIDYPADLGCDSAVDDSEAGEITPQSTGGNGRVGQRQDLGSGEGV